MKIPKKYTEGDTDIHVLISKIRRQCDDYLFDYSETKENRLAKTRKEHLTILLDNFEELESILHRK